MQKWKQRRSKVALIFLPALAIAASGYAQSPPTAPSQYLEGIEARGASGGVMPEADAMDAQAEQIDDTGSAIGLSGPATDRVEEIVVRARRRDEMLEDTPISITALSEDTLREAGVVRLDQIQELVPNLQFQSSNSGQAAEVRIRGVGTSTEEIAFDPGVGIYIDGVFLPRALGGIIDTVDVQQVEVLRGPQGTLFGKNTVGGAINITTVKPGQDLEGFVMVRPGNLEAFDGRVMLNIPIDMGWLEDRLFTRVAFAARTNDGYVENTLVPQQLSNRNSLSFLGSLRFLPVDDIRIDLSGTWSKDQNAGLGPRCVPIQETALTSLFPGFLNACAEADPYRFAGDTSQLSEVESSGVWGTASWDIGALGPLEELELKSITSWRQQSSRIRLELDGTPYRIVQLSGTGGPNPLDGEPGSQRQVSQELQFGGSALDQDLHFVVGLFGLWETGLDSRTVASGMGVLNYVTNNRNRTDNWTWAPFAQASYDVTPWASLTAGVRYTRDKKGADVRTSTPLDPDALPGFESAASEIFSSWTPMASLALNAPDTWFGEGPVDHLMGYFTYARGFKGGGFNAVFNPNANSLDSFGPETLDSYEIGFKTIGFDERLTCNVSVFYGQYDDIQVTSVRDITPEGATQPELVQLTQNAARATTRGAEFEIVALPLPGLRLIGSLGLLDTDYNSFPNAIDDLTGATLDRSGETFNVAPKLQGHISLQYSWGIDWPGPTWLRGWLTPRLDWYYQSAIHFSGPEIAATNQSGYNLLHARLSYDFFDDRAQVALWSQNLANQEYLAYGLTSVVSSWGVATQYYGAPRTFGAELSYRF